MFSHCESTEEGTRNVVAECLGKLTLVDPLRLLPQLKVCDNPQALSSLWVWFVQTFQTHFLNVNSNLLLFFFLPQEYLNSDSAFARSTVVTAVKFTISDHVRE